MKRKQPTRLSNASETGRMRMIDGRCLLEARGGGESARQPMKRTSPEHPSESVIDAHRLTDVRGGATANGTQADQAGHDRRGRRRNRGSAGVLYIIPIDLAP
jgi:hypothetical protein